MKIKELRQLTGLSQTQFAKKFNIPPNTIRGWEQEKRSPPDYVPGMIEEIIRMEQAPIRGQQTIDYKPLSDDDILNDDATAATEPEEQPKPERHKILAYMKASLMDIEIDDLYCENCIHGKECNFNYENCKYHNKKNYRECECIENWIYWEDLERMIDEC